MKLSKCKMYGRILTDFLLPDQIEILQRQVDEEISKAAEAAWMAARMRYTGSTLAVKTSATMAFEKWFEQWKAEEDGGER